MQRVKYMPSYGMLLNITHKILNSYKFAFDLINQ
jgi:hypothetical protein